jgi:hypothetical protein
MELKGWWKDILNFHCPPEDSEFNNNCAVALTWFSAQAAANTIASAHDALPQPNEYSSSALNQVLQQVLLLKEISTAHLKLIGKEKSVLREKPTQFSSQTSRSNNIQGGNND